MVVGYGYLVKSILRAAGTVIERGRDVLWIAVRRRARFEGWFKLELAYELEVSGFKEVTLEERYQESKRADITFKVNNDKCFLELKTCVTNWAVRGVPLITHVNITQEVGSFLDEDLESVKLVKKPNLGVALMLLFPTKAESDIISKIKAWKKHGDRLLGESPLIRTVKLMDEVSIALLLFGPYQDGRLMREPVGSWGPS